MNLITVAIPVLDGARSLGEVLDAVRAQRLGHEVEILVCDSGSRDGSPEIARRAGAEVFSIARESFSHGATRKLLLERAQGSHVAFLTQDAVPANDRWLGRLLGGFALAGDVALAYGPYLPRSEASLPVARELEAWFASLSPDGRPRVDRLTEAERPHARARDLLGPRAFFTDANGCVARAAALEVPFRPVAYAEDHRLALDMLFAGYAKAHVPQAAVVHSHDYRPAELLRRSFDEWRALREVYDYVEPAGLHGLRRGVVGPVRGDARALRARGAGVRSLAIGTIQSAAHHGPRYAGALLGGRAERLPAAVSRRLSLERRAG